ncbi:MAG: monovalent cation/H+ antiporter subunit A [bacterium]
MTVVWIILLPFLAIAPAWWIGRSNRLGSTAISVAAAAAALGALISQSAPVFAGDALVKSWPWIASLGLNFSVRLDGLGFLFALLILGIGVLVLIYASSYLSKDDDIGSFHAMLLTFMGAMLGVVLSENLLLMVMFWELTSISSFLLIAYWSHLPAARQGARLALTITGGGGLALLAGVLMIGHVVGSYELSDVLRSNATILAHPLYVPLLICVLLGAFTKSAQFPFHFWLPNAMTAPTPVSAYLHSATMVKAGVFLLARIHPALSGSPQWFTIVTGAGLVTLVLGAYIALFKDDLKGLLAYSTISHLGIITALFGFSTPLAVVAGVFHILNHAAFKAALFMTAGIVDHEAGTRDIKLLGGLRHLMPITFTLGTIAALSMAGFPPFNGFLSKELFFEEAAKFVEFADFGIIPMGLAVVGGLFSIAYSLRFIIEVFLGPKRESYPHTPHDPPMGMWVPVAVLATICVAIGLAPAFVAGPLVAAAATPVAQTLPDYYLALWHRIYARAVHDDRGGRARIWILPHSRGGRAATGRRPRPRRQAHNRSTSGRGHGCGEFCDHTGRQRLIATLPRVHDWHLPWPLVFWRSPSSDGKHGSVAPTPAPWMALLPWALLVGATVYTVVYQRQRLTAVVFMSVVGLVVSLAFIYFSAPDLGLTQLSVEVVTILLILLSLYVLPQNVEPESSGTRRVRDGMLAILGGLGAAALSWGIMTRPADSISQYYLDNALEKGGGTNVVNVTLVDFRGFDTMGEIAVLVVAAVGILVMLRGRRPEHKGLLSVLEEERFPVMLTTVTRPLMPLIMLAAVYIFWRGHNLPGGGFIAGLVAAVTLLMQYLASGLTWTNKRLGIDFVRVGAVGVSIAVITGLGALLFDKPFLTHAMVHPKLPIIGEFHVGSPAIFDLGVFLAVVAALVVIIRRLSEYQRDNFIDQTRREDP